LIPAPLKILKVLIEELLSASGVSKTLAAAAAEYGDEDEGDDDGWEDVPGILDLGLGSTRKELMAYGEGNYARQPDDETQAYLTEFFVKTAQENLAGFDQFYAMLTEEEKEKLTKLAAGA
jgi:hypothetical protein